MFMAFCPKILRYDGDSMKGTFSFYESRLTGWDTQILPAITKFIWIFLYSEVGEH